MSAATKNKTTDTFAAMLADSELKKKTIQVGGHSVTIIEMTGRQRFELSERADDTRFDTLLWVAFNGIVDPVPPSLEDFEQLRIEWITEIANAVLELSGLATDDEEEAGNGLASVTDTGSS